MHTYSADVVVVGGGISGVCCAYYLTQHDLKVLLVERDGIASHASGFAFGGLSPLAGAGIPGSMFPLAVYSFSLHKKLKSRLGDGSIDDPKYRFVDSLDLAFNEEETETHDSRIRWINNLPGFSAKQLAPEEILEKDSRINPAVISGIYIRGNLQVDSSKLVNTLHRKSDAMLLRNDVVGFDCEGDGIRGVKLGDGNFIATNRVILATGPWLGNGRLDSSLNARVSPLKGQILRVQCQDEPVNVSIGRLGNYISTKDDGLLWAGTTEEDVGFDESTTGEGRDSILENVRFVLPGLQLESVRLQTACIRPMSPDGCVILGEIPDLHGLYVCGGAGRKGILHGPGMGKIVADMVVGDTPAIDVNPYLPSRFS